MQSSTGRNGGATEKEREGEGGEGMVDWLIQNTVTLQDHWNVINTCTVAYTKYCYITGPLECN